MLHTKVQVNYDSVTSHFPQSIRELQLKPNSYSVFLQNNNNKMVIKTIKKWR